MNERDALALLQRLITDALTQQPNGNYVREYAARVGDLEATMRAALTVIELTTEGGAR
ncbi:hypothetical protein [Streptomyces sp. NPDC059909]|uniref:hypothetical protein n=1 Tax=Streptomyces sp. NPDC059909 TaxID=3346998 RepID=UPI0036655B59